MASTALHSVIGVPSWRSMLVLAKAELFQGAWAWLMRGHHAFPVVRHSPDRTALRRDDPGAGNSLKNGVAIARPRGHNARLMADDISEHDEA